MFGIIDVSGISENDIYTTIAKILINIDRGCDVFNGNVPIWTVDESFGVFTYYPKHINVYIDDGLLGPANFRFYLNARIYEIVKEHKLDVGYSYKPTEQHLLKIQKRAASFQEPLVDITFNLEILKIDPMEYYNCSCIIFFMNGNHLADKSLKVSTIFDKLFNFTFVIVHGWLSYDPKEFEETTVEEFILKLEPSNVELCRMILLDILMGNKNVIHTTNILLLSAEELADKTKFIMIHRPERPRIVREPRPAPVPRIIRALRLALEADGDDEDE